MSNKRLMITKCTHVIYICNVCTSFFTTESNQCDATVCKRGLCTSVYQTSYYMFLHTMVTDTNGDYAFVLEIIHPETLTLGKFFSFYMSNQEVYLHV